MLFDAGCHGCETRPGPLCAACRSKLRSAGRLEVPGLDACRAALWLDDTVRALIAAFKYRHQRRLAKVLAASMIPLVPLAADTLTWVPTTDARRRSRGYDQSRELALRLGRATGVPVRRLVVRRPGDDRQTGRSRRERLGGPDLATAGVASRFVVVVDDVLTTGSSVRVAAGLLRESGACRVVGLVAAATPLERTPIGSRLPLWKSD